MADKRSNLRDSRSGDVDLAVLVLGLWRGKRLITAFTIAAAVISLLYIYFATPTYEATSRVMPPTASDLISYNAASQLTGTAINDMMGSSSDAAIASIKIITPEDAYAAFIVQLRSRAVMQKFFNEYYSPTLSDKLKLSEQRLWKRLQNDVTVTPPQQGDVSTTVTVMADDPRLAADWANAYTQLGMQATKSNLIANLAGEVEVRKNGVRQQIATLKRVAKETRATRIVRLNNALEIAEKIGLEEPSPRALNITINEASVNANGEGLLYLRGSKALRSELAVLERRKTDDAYIEELPDLLKKQSLLDSIKLDASQLKVARVDYAARPPEDPSRPRKLLVLALGTITGLMMGLFAALAAQFFSRSSRAASM
ncbi:LPS O-antigen chain length determinant protein WzzB [Pusillimonas sp. ANT_WB101]|uniref:LPS O-antigen chain length determinant protein WzzB n=1 Tax=Pusillimonas sp. ANT_WB101 TaxID=2597356 RepID=UPI00165E4BF3|nr:Wzz/FepE/Etk N-terminal domain-containing protein [Pusillimonas sp. ANT_WB101]